MTYEEFSKSVKDLIGLNIDRYLIDDDMPVDEYTKEGYVSLMQFNLYVLVQSKNDFIYPFAELEGLEIVNPWTDKKYPNVILGKGNMLFSASYDTIKNVFRMSDLIEELVI